MTVCNVKHQHTRAPVVYFAIPTLTVVKTVCAVSAFGIISFSCQLCRQTWAELSWRERGELFSLVNLNPEHKQIYSHKIHLLQR